MSLDVYSVWGILERISCIGCHWLSLVVLGKPRMTKDVPMFA